MTRGESSSSAGDPVTKPQFEKLMAAMKDQMATRKWTLTDEREEVDERLVMKMCFDFNEEVQNKIKSAQKSLSSTLPVIERAKKALKEGEDLLQERQKLIRINS